jgi:small subunit ribosomal protein S18
MADMRRGGGRGESGDKEGRPMRPRRSRRKVCAFCADKIEHIEYKDSGKLRKFISERGKILPKRMSGNCARHQRELTIAVKRARHIALLPYSGE